MFRLMCLRFSDAFVHSVIGCLGFAFTYSDYAQLSLMKHRSIISALIFAEHKESIEWIVFIMPLISMLLCFQLVLLNDSDEIFLGRNEARTAKTLLVAGVPPSGLSQL
jgi:hypothetical protein